MCTHTRVFNCVGRDVTHACNAGYHVFHGPVLIFNIPKPLLANIPPLRCCCVHRTPVAASFSATGSFYVQHNATQIFSAQETFRLLLLGCNPVMVDLKQVDTRIAEVRACEGLLGIVSRMRSNEGLINTQPWQPSCQ